MGLSSEQFDQFKQAYISWMSRRLGELRVAEEMRAGKLEPLDLEDKFGDALRLLNRRAVQPRNASFLAQRFDKKQMGIIFSLLDDMIDASVGNSDQAGFGAGSQAVNQYNLTQRDAIEVRTTRRGA